MEITRVLIKNFRSIKDVDIVFHPTTVLIGPNNIGKTAILDAVRIARSRRWGQRGTGFTEHDVRDARLVLDEGEPDATVSAAAAPARQARPR